MQDGDEEDYIQQFENYVYSVCRDELCSYIAIKFTNLLSTWMRNI